MVASEINYLLKYVEDYPMSSMCDHLELWKSDCGKTDGFSTKFAGGWYCEQIVPNNVKVCVDDVVGEYQTTPLPVPCSEHKMIGEAAGSFLQWPKTLVLL